MHSDNAAFEQVLASARNGDSRAFEQLYVRLNKRVHGFVRARGAAEPEDTVNETFLAVFTRLGAFTGGQAQFNAWVFTIARNKLIDEHRKQQRRVQEVSANHVGVDTIVANTAVSNDVAQEAIDHISTAGLAQRLHFLTEDQRDAVLLLVVGDLSIGSITEVLHRDSRAVRSLVSRAFRTIARIDSSIAVSQ